MRLIAVSVGRPHVLVRNGRQYSTAINKRPVDGPVRVTDEGVQGDRVSDTSVHGGPDKAVCVYPHEHYAHFRQRLREARGDPDLDLDVPAFGENFTTVGLLETDVCLGDSFQCGGVLVQVTQPRQPCFKLASKHLEPRIIGWIHQTAFCGFYFRVLEAGAVCAGDRFERVAVGSDVSVAAALRARVSREPPPDLLTRLARLESAAASLRDWAVARLGGDDEVVAE